MKDIVIIGAGGFAREIAWLIEEINSKESEWNILGFVDDDENLLGTNINGYKVLGNIDWLKQQNVSVANAIANPIVKKKVVKRLESTNISYPVLIHPNVIYSNSVSFGEGTIVCASNTLTVNIKIGKHVIINLDCTIGHDATIGDYSTILPSVNVSGFVDIQNCASIGTGSAIIQGISVGENSIVGAGSVVIKDLPSNCTAVGVPAKPIHFR